MKKFTIIIAAVLLAGISCSKDFNGSYPHQKPVDLHTYMEGFVEFYLTDHLWVMERALSFDERALYESIPTSAEYSTGGKSIWTVGTVWTASEVQSLSGITIERGQDDSTWTHSVDMEKKINDLRTELKSKNMDDINEHKYSFALGTMYSSIVGELEKLGDFVMNVMEAKFQRLERAVEPEVIE